VSLVAQLATVLDQAHALEMVHRDLKPANLFLHRGPAGRATLKVLDFGLVTALRGLIEHALTQTGMILGTPHYMAPEQARADHLAVGPHTDRWAVGMIAFELLSGQRYWGEGPSDAFVTDLRRAVLVPPSELVPGLGAAFDAWFARSCHRELAERFGSAREQVAALAAALSTAPTSELPASLHPVRLVVPEAASRPGPLLPPPGTPRSPGIVGTPHTPGIVGTPHTPGVPVSARGAEHAPNTTKILGVPDPSIRIAPAAWSASEANPTLLAFPALAVVETPPVIAEAPADAPSIDLLWHAPDVAERLGDWRAHGKSPFEVMTRAPTHAPEVIAAEPRRWLGRQPRPLALVAGELAPAFDEVARLRALVALATPAAAAPEIAAAIATAQQVLAVAELTAASGVPQAVSARLREVLVGANTTTREALERTSERMLLAAHRYDLRAVLGQALVRATLSGAGELTAYLPRECAALLPLFRRHRVRVLAEVHAPQEEDEPGVCLRVVALARVLT
jgi:hypothetical protein